MASFDPIDYDPNGPPPRPDTPPVRRGFVMILLILLVAAVAVYGIPYVAEQVGYRYEVGRARAAARALESLDEAGVVNRASALFRLASTRVQPAVVNVRTSQLAPIQGPRGRAAPGRMVMGSGSGVVIDKDRGYVVTNHHVIKAADEIIVRIGRRQMPARLVGSDEKTDLAVLQVEGRLSAEAEWGDSDRMDIGDWVLAIGSPYELDRTVTAGIVSATGRGGLPIFSPDLYQDFIQTDAAINPGNSGGPLINLSGEVIGINTAILSETGGYQGIGLAISSAMARQVVEQLIEEGRVIRGYLGVTIRNLLPDELDEAGLDEARGARVENVMPGGPAARAGLKSGDIVVSIAGQPVDDSNDLRNQTFSLPIDKRVPVTYYRDGQKQTVEVTIDAMPVPLDLGMVVVEKPLNELPPSIIEQIPDRPLPDHLLLVAAVMPGSPAARAGLRPDLRVTAVGEEGVPVDSLETFNTLASSRYDRDQGLTLQVETIDGTPYEVTVGGSDPGVTRP